MGKEKEYESIQADVLDVPLTLKYHGDFDLDGLLGVLRGWFSYMLMDIEEPKFKYKVGGGGKEIEFVFKGDRKITIFGKITAEVNGFIWNAKEKEVVIDGVKTKITTGRIKLVFQGTVILDWTKMFDPKTSKVNKFLNKFLNTQEKGLLSKENKYYFKYLGIELGKFHASVKEFLKMECS